MMDRAEHIEFDTLNDYVDGRLAGSEATAVERHLRVCQACSAEHQQLVTMLDGVALLPRSVLPEVDGWNDLKTSLEQRKEVVLPVADQGSIPVHLKSALRRGTNRRHVMLAVAALLLVALSSGITAVALRSSDRSLAGTDERPTSAPAINSGALPVLPASFRAAEGEYARTIDELRTSFDAQRGQLSPETVRTVERSLTLIDAAIAEARDALLADPGNRTLVDLLSANYQRKLDLLRRTSELSSRT